MLIVLHEFDKHCLVLAVVTICGILGKSESCSFIHFTRSQSPTSLVEVPNAKLIFIQDASQIRLLIDPPKVSCVPSVLMYYVFLTSVNATGPHPRHRRLLIVQGCTCIRPPCSVQPKEQRSCIPLIHQPQTDVADQLTSA